MRRASRPPTDLCGCADFGKASRISSVFHNNSVAVPAILFAATLLCARKLIELDSDRPSPAKVAAVENAISQAAFILQCIDRKWPEK
jgi:hypothetical protein